MTFSEDSLLPISALQHLLFCERQCALIHLEQAWAENRLTAEGRILHDKVHDADAETRGDIRIVRGLRLRSLRLGVTGVADVVELHRDDAGVPVAELSGRWRVMPVEYKRGKPKPDVCDEVQLCAQAMCLEEMMNCAIAEGALFYGTPRRRQIVALDPILRDITMRAALRLHELLESGVTPPAVHEKKCEQCSLSPVCLPQIAGVSAAGYLKSQISDFKSNKESAP